MTQKADALIASFMAAALVVAAAATVDPAWTRAAFALFVALMAAVALVVGVGWVRLLVWRWKADRAIRRRVREVGR